MTFPRSPTLRVVALAAILLVLAGAALAAATTLGLTFQGSQRKEGLLATTNRDRLAICVQAVGTDTAAQVDVKRRIEALLPQLKEHPLWRGSGLDTAAPPVVDIGCPSDPALLRPGADIKGGEPFSSRVFEPSRYRVFVFILPQEEIDRLFANWPLRRVPQEDICEDHVCGEVTTGLYLSPEEAKQPSLLKKLLLEGIGLELPDLE